MTRNQLIKLVSFALVIIFITMCLGRVFYYSKSDMRKRIYTYSTKTLVISCVTDSKDIFDPSLLK